MSLTNATTANWQPGHVPQLRYRNPAPTEDIMESIADKAEPLRELTNINDNGRPSSRSRDNPKPSGPTIQQIRQSMTQAPRPPSQQPAFNLPQPRKKSMFGSFFSGKEPTQMALNQVQAQMIAQHGSTSATKVPNVRMEKMPAYVPKVNSKWDGVPEQVKARERREKERQKARKRQSVMGEGGSNRSRSVDGQERTNRSRTSYTSSSNASRPRSITSRGPESRDARRANPHRFYAASCNSSGDLAAQQRDGDQNYESEDEVRREQAGSTVSQSVRTPSITSLPRETAYFPADRPSYPIYHHEKSTAALSEASSSTKVSSTRDPNQSYVQAPAIEAIPEHTSSPIATPRDQSPITPLTQQVNDMSISEASQPVSMGHNPPLIVSEPSLIPEPVPMPRQAANSPPPAFLAGEAQELRLSEDSERPDSPADLPLRSWGGFRSKSSNKRIDKVISGIEKRPDSSRSRLGLKASMLVRTDTAPWESHDGASVPPLSPAASASTKTSSGPLTPRSFLGKSFYGSLRSTRS